MKMIPINMNTLKLEVSRSTIDSLITKDRAARRCSSRFLCAGKTFSRRDCHRSQTLGQRTLSPEDLRMLVEDKFVDALRATAAQITMHELQDTRGPFVQGVQNTVAENMFEKRPGTGKRFTYQTLTRPERTFQSEQCL